MLRNALKTLSASLLIPKKSKMWWLTLPLRLLFACMLLIPLIVAIIVSGAVTVSIIPFLKLQQYIHTSFRHHANFLRTQRKQLHVH
ncbi:MAG: hypothetical protein ACR2FN_06575 [Chitinophagaceae bacterium]